MDYLVNYKSLVKRYSWSKFLILVILTIIGSILEGLGIGLIFPIMAIVLDPNQILNYFYISRLITFLKFTVEIMS